MSPTQKVLLAPGQRQHVAHEFASLQYTICFYCHFYSFLFRNSLKLLVLSINLVDKHSDSLNYVFQNNRGAQPMLSAVPGLANVGRLERVSITSHVNLHFAIFLPFLQTEDYSAISIAWSFLIVLLCAEWPLQCQGVTVQLFGLKRWYLHTHKTGDSKHRAVHESTDHYNSLGSHPQETSAPGGQNNTAKLTFTAFVQNETQYVGEKHTETRTLT